MGNLNKKLDILFRQYLIRKEKERLTPTYTSYRYDYSQCNSWMNDTDKYDGVIYFYEWSDPNRAPQLFYNIGAFDSFLRRSQIFMPPFQKDIIHQLERAFVTCKKGTHDLLIRGTLDMLRDAVSRNDSQGVDIKTAGQAIMNTPIVIPNGAPGGRMPPMYNGYPEEWY